MQRVRLTLTALLTVLLVAFMFTACQEDNPTDVTTPDNIGGENDAEVGLLTLTVGQTNLTDYYGKTDSLTIVATAKRNDGTVVSDAAIVISIETGPGSIVLPNGNTTNESGQVSGKLAVTMLTDTTTVIKAEVNGNVKRHTVDINVEDIVVTMAATPLTQEVVTGEQGQSTLKVRVKNNNGVAVTGVPINLQLVSGAGTLSEPEFDQTAGAYTATLTVDAVDSLIQTSVKAFVNPGGDIIIGAGGGGNGKMAATEEEPPVVTQPRNRKGSREIAESVTEAEIMISMTPSSARVSSIFVNAEEDLLTVAPGESQQTVITLVAYDQNNNGVPELQLHMRVSNTEEGGVAGSISTPPLTDETGMTTAILSTNLRYGEWVIEASAGPSFTTVYTDTVTVMTGSAQQIQVTADTTRIAVFGTNGVESTQLRAAVKDENGNSVQDGTMVYFLLTEFPWESNDEARMQVGESYGQDSPYEDILHPASPYGLPFDSAATNGGQAVISLQSGSTKGPLRLRTWAYLTPDRSDSIVATYNGVQVVAGPPESVEIDFKPMGEDDGGAIWVVEVSARVQDVMNNDVADGYQVIFTVDSDHAHIGDGATGNLGPVTDTPVPGVAFTGLRYHSEYTNEVMDMTASVIQGSTGLLVSDTYEIKLPIQGASGVISVSPANFNYARHTNETWAAFEVTVFVYDAHGHAINNQEVLYSPQFGRMYNTDVYVAQNIPTPRALTGPADYGEGAPPDGDAPGTCTRYLIITVEEAFPEPTNPVNNCNISAELVGVEDVSLEPVTVFLYNY